jgi:hypothetical protein
MKKVVICAAAFLALSAMANKSFAQLQDEKNVTITMDLQPILQLDMSTPDQIDFVFDDIGDYAGGITKYGATILKVSATVNWDLWAVGTSNANMSGTGDFWDVQASYGVLTDVNTATGVANSASNQIPLHALELHQHGVNLSTAGSAGGFADYSTPFANPSSQLTGAAVGVGATAWAPGQNNIYVPAGGAAAVYTIPSVNEKFIQGHNDPTALIPGGSYLTQSFQNATGNPNGQPVAAGAEMISAYYNVIDYRIVPGLPVQFPLAADNTGTLQDLGTVQSVETYAAPGVYTMNVKYILAENQ